MDEVTIGQLRARAGNVLGRAQAGERLAVTQSGQPVAELRPLSRRALDASTLLERWRHLPRINPLRHRPDDLLSTSND